LSENTLQLIAGLKLVWVACFAILYGFGGISNKWLRRFVGPFWMGLGVYGFSTWTGSFHPWYLAYPLLLAISLHLGYGGDSIGKKLRKRSIYGLALGVSALPLCFGNYLWLLFGFHVVLCVAVSVILGVFNPAKTARNEETLIAALSTIIVLYLI
jgi:hypothetical protein